MVASNLEWKLAKEFHNEGEAANFHIQQGSQIVL